MEYNPFSLEIESSQTNVLKTTQELGVAVVAYSPLGRGLFTGRFKSRDDFDENDFRRKSPRFSPENFPKNLELVSKLENIAARKNATASQLVLRWLLAQSDNIIPIPGTKRIKYFDDNMAALNLELSDEENREIRAAVEEADVHGGRYPLGWHRTLFADTVPLK